MPKKTMERCSVSLLIREMRIKTTVRFHLTPRRMVIITKRERNIKCCEAGALVLVLRECQTMQLLWKTPWGSLINSIELPQNPEILSVFPKL